jgi:hypothetical protein
MHGKRLLASDSKSVRACRTCCRGAAHKRKPAIVRFGPVDEINGPFITELIPEKRKRPKVLIDVSRYGAGRLDLYNSVVLAGAWLVDEQVWLGLSASLKIRVSPLVHFTVESVRTILGP